MNAIIRNAFLLLPVMLGVADTAPAAPARNAEVVLPNTTASEEAAVRVLRERTDSARLTRVLTPRKIAETKSVTFTGNEAVGRAVLRERDKRRLQSSLSLPDVESVQLVQIDTAAFARERHTVMMTDNTAIRLDRAKAFLGRPVLRDRYAVDNNSRAEIWSATLGGDRPGSAHLFKSRNGQLRGSVTLGNELYLVRQLRPDSLILEKIAGGGDEPEDDTSSFADDETVSGGTATASGQPAIEFDCAEAPSEDIVIDVVVGFTRLAATQAWERRRLRIEEIIADQLAIANRSLSEAGARVSLRLAAPAFAVRDFVEATSSETGHSSMCRNMIALREGRDGLDLVQRLRKRARADLAIIVAHHPVSGHCGMAAAIGTDRLSDAVAAVNWQCLFSGKYSLTHEVGHLVGAEHSVSPGGNASAQARFAHGFINEDDGAKFVTVMGKRSHCTGGSDSCTRIGAWSNPRMRWLDFALGSDERNNACIWRARGPIVAELSDQHAAGEPVTEPVYKRVTDCD